jgi:cytoskeleton protein RodZ
MLKFSGTCWVEIRDSKGSWKLVGGMQKGEEHILKGTPPYTVVLGDSDNVAITIDNKPFNIQDYSRSGVARFTFDPTTVNQ